MREFDLGAVTAYALAVKNGFKGTEQEWLTSLVPNLSIGEVKTVEAGSPAAAVMGGTSEKPVLNLSLPRGVNGCAADWNQSDPAQPDYVKNRTHYEGVEMVEILPETVLDMSSEVQLYKLGLVVGKTYKVVINGEAYKCVAQEIVDGDMTCAALGDIYTLTDGGRGTMATGEPFVLMEYPPELVAAEGIHGAFMFIPFGFNESVTTFALAVYGDGLVLHKLDNKYLDLAWLPVVNESLIEEVHTVGNGNFKSDKLNIGIVYAGMPLIVYFDGVRNEVVVDGDGGANNGHFFYINDSTGTVVAIISFNQYGYVVQSTEGAHTVAFYLPEPNRLPTKFLPDCVESVTLQSSTAGSTKRFKLTVDDTGVITATEVTD